MSKWYHDTIKAYTTYRKYIMKRKYMSKPKLAPLIRNMHAGVLSPATIGRVLCTKMRPRGLLITRTQSTESSSIFSFLPAARLRDRYDLLACQYVPVLVCVLFLHVCQFMCSRMESCLRFGSNDHLKIDQINNIE